MKLLGTNPKWCKGCGICVAFCPREVLTLKKGKVFINSADECIKCGTCENLCPDFAVFLYEEETNNG